MLDDIKWAEDGTYRPNHANSPEKFFNDSLKNSEEFDLKLGYFSSAAISVLADGFATFISNGGKMRLAINHIVSGQDKEAITKGMKSDPIDCIDLSNFAELRKTFDEYQKQFFDCLAYLIHVGRIDIRIIKPKNPNGMAHTKSGQFRDGLNVISFTGSANFTIAGFYDNIEEITISRSASLDVMVQNRIKSQREDFDSIMSGEDNSVEYLSSENLIAAIRSNFGQDKDIEELLDVEKKLKKVKFLHRKLSGDSQESVVAEKPQFPYVSGPREYQKLAFENWKNNNQRGLFAMATGTGKTITSLNCLLEIYKAKGYYKAIILVPTITLVNQWEVECRKFKFSNIIKVYSKNPSWRDEVDRIYFNEKYHSDRGREISYIIIVTYASYARINVFNTLNTFDKNKLLMIADECHNMGSGLLVKKIKQIPYFRRIGLSATPERQFDDIGNEKLKKFFGVEEKYTYEYSMKEAIANGVLCRYMYYPHVVRLNSLEMSEYLELSLKIAKYFNFSTETFDIVDDILKRLLLARKRIIHKATNKIPAFTDIIKQRFKEKGNLKYSLIYVPEGNIPDYIGEECFDTIEEISDDDDANHLIDIYTKIVTQIDDRVTVKKFTSGQKNREEILNDFAKGNLHVLTSMKCLDEGVDVPRSELAIFCSSTGNPRQFIQRRGRILRTHPDKSIAEIHDLIVVPEVSHIYSDSYLLERSLLKGELKRVNNFALLSENPSYSDIALREVMDYYGLNLYNNNHIK